jgi:AraC-like DNA-binding protein
LEDEQSHQAVRKLKPSDVKNLSKKEKAVYRLGYQAGNFISNKHRKKITSAFWLELLGDLEKAIHKVNRVVCDIDVEKVAQLGDSLSKLNSIFNEMHSTAKEATASAKPGRHRSYTAEDLEQARLMLARGESLREIAKVIGIGVTTLHYALNGRNGKPKDKSYRTQSPPSSRPRPHRPAASHTSAPAQAARPHSP